MNQLEGWEVESADGCEQTIDYTAHQPLHTFLAEKHGSDDTRFDYVFDCVGDQTLYEHSPPFLKPGGKFICLSGGKWMGIPAVLKNNVWPKFLWGSTPRTYRLLGLAPNGEYMREVVRLVEEGVIKKVPIDSEYGMEQAVEVSYLRVLFVGWSWVLTRW